MTPKSMIVPIISGTPWKRKYKAMLDWDSNFLHFKPKDAYVVQPFVTLGNRPTTTIQEIVITSKGKQTVHEQMCKAPCHDNYRGYLSPLTSKP